MRQRDGHGWCWSRSVTLEELQDRLQKYEWADIEFKKARRGVPLDDGLYALAEHLEGRADRPQHGQSASDQVRDRHGDMATDQDMATAHVEHRPANMSTAHGHEEANKVGKTVVPTPKSAQFIKITPISGNDEVHDGGDDRFNYLPGMSTAHVRRRPANMSTAHDAPKQPSPPAALSAVQRRIVAYCDVPRLLAEMMAELGVANRGHFKKNHLDPLIHDGLIAMTNPAKPRAPGQRYVLTEAGARLKALYMDAEQ